MTGCGSGGAQPRESGESRRSGRVGAFAHTSGRGVVLFLGGWRWPDVFMVHELTCGDEKRNTILFYLSSWMFSWFRAALSLRRLSKACGGLKA